MAAEQVLPYVPAAGRNAVTLTSWAGDAVFGVTRLRAVKLKGQPLGH